MSSRTKYLTTNEQGSSIYRILVAFLFAAFLGSTSCQTYTTGLKQDVARANELSALATLHAIALAQQTYSVSNGGKYGTARQLVEGGFLDSYISDSEKKDPNISNSEKKDYVFTIEVGQSAGGASEEFYSCKADPKDKPGRHFYMDSTSREIHVNPTQPATAADPTYQP